MKISNAQFLHICRKIILLESMYVEILDTPKSFVFNYSFDFM